MLLYPVLLPQAAASAIEAIASRRTIDMMPPETKLSKEIVY